MGHCGLKGVAAEQWRSGVVEWWCDALGCHGWQRAATWLGQKLGGDTAGRELPGNYGAFWGQNAWAAVPVGHCGLKGVAAEQWRSGVVEW